jgi:RsiW-degrading membrane proteinase PrsW (M82 family)
MTALAFIYGALAGSAALLAQVFFLLIFGESVSLTHFTLTSLIGAALIEESSKLLFLVQIFKRFGAKALAWHNLLSFGLGFATLEIFLSLLSQRYNSSVFLLVLTNTLLHLITVFIIGLFLRRFSLSKARLLLILLMILTGLHALFNFFRLQT